MLDIVASVLGLLMLSPLLMVVVVLIWLQDYKSPLYVASRVGRDGRPFSMIKLRSMSINADKTGVESTSAGDSRITPIGHFIRRIKLDELSQLWNVLLGDMSLVGPRPNTQNGVNVYTDIEQGLLSVRPGITDFSSIVFSDEGDILEGESDPDLTYNQIMRPWKSRLGLIYIENRSIFLDLQLILYTMVAIVSKERALMWVADTLQLLGVDEKVIAVSRRDIELTPYHPPGSSEIVTTHNAANTAK